MEAAYHANCDPGARAGTQQTCDRCKRTLTVTPQDDFYCADGSADHVCEACLVDGRRIELLLALLANRTKS